MKKITTTVLFIIALLFSTSITAQSTWKAPKSADEIKNHLKNDAVTTKNGKKLYTQMCVICHGAKGKGDGIAGMALKPKPASFITEVFSNQTDGAIFWKITEGKTPMAAYKELLSEEERWQLINYMRTLKTK
jgi:mono/diheme cytochrome c family protein